jgi:osmotically inducible lipoprotein OsmB
MKIVVVVAAFALTLAGCANSTRDYNAVGGAVVGGGTGAVIGGLATRSVGGAVAGGVIGAVAGGLIGEITTHHGRCYMQTPSGRLRRVHCP